jgi:hypothetical protein
LPPGSKTREACPESWARIPSGTPKAFSGNPNSQTPIAPLEISCRRRLRTTGTAMNSGLALLGNHRLIPAGCKTLFPPKFKKNLPKKKLESFAVKIILILRTNYFFLKNKNLRMADCEIQRIVEQDIGN